MFVQQKNISVKHIKSSSVKTTNITISHPNSTSSYCYLKVLYHNLSNNLQAYHRKGTLIISLHFIHNGCKVTPM